MKDKTTDIEYILCFTFALFVDLNNEGIAIAILHGSNTRRSYSESYT